MKKAYRILLFFSLLINFNQVNLAYPEEENVAENAMSRKFQEYIQKGYIEIGMTKDDVRSSWGEPQKIKRKKTYDYDEIWIYTPNWKFQNKLYFENGILVKTEPTYLVVSQMDGHGVMP